MQDKLGRHSFKNVFLLLGFKARIRKGKYKMSDYLAGLNEPQRLAVENTEGPSLVIAGAGSGKTRVLTFRIAHLLRKGTQPSSILALTFTNKAAREMKARIAHVAGNEVAKQLWMGTFHSIFSKILRFEHEFIGFPSSFTIYDTNDSKNLLKTIVKDLKLDPQAYKPNEVLSRISMAKNNLVTAQSYAEKIQFHESDAARQKPFLYKVYQEYAKRCFKAGAMDFDDLLLYTNILFRDHKEVLEKYQNRFRYIMVDEYQDTNHSQYRIIRQLAAAHQNLCVVGDDAQSIYSFRGAKIENILNFQSDYKNYKLFKLEQNYRSTQTIVNAANSIIAKNQNQLKKTTFSENDEGNKIKIIQSYTDNEEGFMVANTIVEKRMDDHSAYNDFAILYRTNAQSRIMEESLRKKNIPYKIYGGTSFYQRKEIKDVLAYLRLIINKRDDEAFKRVVNYPKRGIGDTSLGKIEKLANHHGMSIWNTMMSSNAIHDVASKAIVNKLYKFAELIEEFSQLAKTEDAHTVASEVVSKTGILKELFESRAPEDISRHQNVQELLNGIKEFVTLREENDESRSLSEYMQDVALLTDMDGEEEKDTVTLMTIHSSKGLEFRHVFLVGLEEELFPSQMTTVTPQDLEEERRLFYVAVTRAEKSVQISFARSRYKWGKLTQAMPSRFLRDIDPQFIESSFENEEYVEGGFSREGSRNFGARRDQQSFSNRKFNRTENNTEQDIRPKFKRANNTNSSHSKPKLTNVNKTETNFKSDNPQDLKAGMQIEHPRFGKGQIISLDGSWPNTKASINFQQSGSKQLLLKFAKLRIIK